MPGSRSVPRAAGLRGLGGIPALAIVPRLALLYLVLHPGIRWWERMPVILLAGAGLLVPGLPRRAWLWLALAAALGAALLLNWPLSDNHDYLKVFFCLALWGALLVPDSERALARDARLLIGLTFAFATLWKGVLSPDFLDGTFFRVALLTDSRFTDLALLLGGMDDAAFDRFETARQAALRGVPWLQAGFHEPAALRRLAAALTLSTLLAEGALALLFLLPGARLAAWRDAALLGFCASTYAFANVAGFGALLVVMGLAQCPPERWRTRLAYLTTFFLVLVYRAIPLGDWLRG